MRNYRIGGMVALGCLIAFGTMASAQPAKSAAITPQQMLAYKPKQEGVVITTPTDAEISHCKVDIVKGANNTSAWVLRDARGQLLRRFADTKGTNSVDAFSYYLDGIEVYREIDANGNRKIDNYRWFGPGGMRWGVDVDENGTIDGWQQISVEEVSQEVLKAVATKNYARLQALMLSEQDLKALQLSPQESARIKESMARIPAKFQETCSKLSALNDSVTWQHLEARPPQCIPAEDVGGKFDLVRYDSCTILYVMGNKPDWLQTGELVLVGRAWRLVGAPIPGPTAQAPTGVAAHTGGSGAQMGDLPEASKPLIEKLQELDKKASNLTSAADIVRYNLERAAIVEQILGTMKTPQQQEQWVKQVADCYATATQNSGPADTTAYKRLVDLRDRVAKAQPGSALAGYVTFREMSADYAMKIAKPGSKPDDLTKIQEAWCDRLKEYVKDFPKTDDAPDALLQLGMVSEFMNKQNEAKNYYGILAKNYAQHPMAAKAQGALRRLSIDGHPLELSGTILGKNQIYNIGSQQGKIRVVYYWASWNQQCAADFAKLVTLSKAYQAKGLEVISVNLDTTPAAAMGFLQQNEAPGVHLHEAGGLDSPLATQYGITVLPNLFLVGKDGKVVSSTIQVSGLEDELKKLVDK